MSNILIKIKIIKESLRRIKCENIVCKSNLYGFGYDILQYLQDDIKMIVVTGQKEYEKISKIIHTNQKYIILYEDIRKISRKKIINQKDINYCLNSKKHLDYVDLNGLNKKLFYIRIDEFLGMHGLSFDDIRYRKDLHKFKGLLVHINEYLDSKEKVLMDQYMKLAISNNLILNIGGSKAYDYYIRRNNPCLEYRFATDLFRNFNSESVFILSTNIICSKYIYNEPIEIGYKSDRKIIKKGQLILIGIGYGDWSLITRIYMSHIKLRSGLYEFELPVYPCMNTTWLYCNKIVKMEDELIFFSQQQEINALCLELNIDLDEFYTSFSSEIQRIII